MPFIGKILQEAVKLGGSLMRRRNRHSFSLQQKTLLKMVNKAKNTAFGIEYGFSDIIGSSDPLMSFQKAVPVFDYNALYGRWWFRTLKGEENVCWPGKTKYFALTSGTSEASSKQIPVTNDMIRAMRRAGIRQALTLSQYKLPGDFYEKSMLMLGGSISLNKVGIRLEGDLSGILANKLPFWFYHFYKPGKFIAKEKDWNTKLTQITHSAKDWSIGVIAGVPAWVQILMEKIIRHYNVSNIHEIWPDFKFYVHGGVSFEPYKKSFAKLLGKEVFYLETYLASEGFLAFQTGYKNNTMELLINNGIFFEFIPVNDNNFLPDGTMCNNPETLLIDQVKLGEEYALLISTCSGTWRYLIGDTIKFNSLENHEIIITGRTRHFLSLCGEHLSVDNMNRAVKMAADELNINIREFTVSGIPFKNLFAHHWYIGTDDPVNAALLKAKIDESLKRLNDDYGVERQAALKDIFVDVLPVRIFYEWMKAKGKEGGQNKFPRVLKNEQLNDWENFIQKNHSS